MSVWSTWRLHALVENFTRTVFPFRSEATINGRLASYSQRTFTTKRTIPAGECSGYGYLLTLSLFDAIHHDVGFEPTGLRTNPRPGAAQPVQLIP